MSSKAPMLDTEASNAPFQPLPDDNAGTSASGQKRQWVRIAAVASAAMFVTMLVFFVWPLQSERVIFPTPTSMQNANELLQNLPQMDTEELYEVSVAPHISLMYQQFLDHYGSTAPHLQAALGTKSPVHTLSSEAFSERLLIFAKSVKNLMRMNAETSGQGPDRATFGINFLADWSDAERAILASGRRSPEDSKANGGLQLSNATMSHDALQAREAQYVYGDFGSDECPEGYEPIMRESLCSDLADANDHSFHEESVPDYPRGCYQYRAGAFYFNVGSSSADRNARRVCQKSHGPAPTPSPPPSPTPTPEGSVNWAAQYPDTFEVRQQGSCGSCWAHSVTNTLRQHWTIKQLGDECGKLSVQWAIDCIQPFASSGDCGGGVGGCCGGDEAMAFKYIARHGGIPTMSTYGPSLSASDPGTRHRCRSVAPFLTLTGPAYLRTESEIKHALFEKGSVNIGVHADNSWFQFNGGVLNQRTSGGQNHAVVAVGFDGDKSCYIVQNSWGTEWGVQPTPPYSTSGSRGFILLKYGINVANIEGLPATMPEGVRRAGSAEVSLKEVLAPPGSSHTPVHTILDEMKPKFV